VREIQVKSVLNKKKSRDSWFLDDYTLNPYEGCSFNCQYCYVRGSKYGENMAETLAVKINGPEILDRQLAFRAKKNQFGMIALASATDPYLALEDKYRITASFLELIHKHCFPVLIITKSALVTRDIEILRKINSSGIHHPDVAPMLSGGSRISFSFSTLDRDIAATLEPGAPPPQQRIETLMRCKDAGLNVGVNLIPVLPFINDTEEALDQMIAAFKAAGADYVLGGGLTLFGSGPADSKTLYYKFLERKFPRLVADYKRLYRIFFYPPKDYHARLSEMVRVLCEKYNMRDRII
jgi:DNA repair photolyase